MNVDIALEQLSELIKRDYRFPRFTELTVPKTVTNASASLDPMPEHISVKDCIMPVLKDYEYTKKRESYLVEVVMYFVNHGCLFSYLDNVKKQKFINELHDAIPEVNWPIHYPDTAYQNKNKNKTPADGNEK